MVLLITALFLAFSTADTASADVYVYKDTDGKILLTDRPRSNMTLAYVAPKDLSSRRDYFTKSSSSASTEKATSSEKSSIKYFTRYHSIIRQAASRYKLDHKLVSAVVQVESQFNPKAVSRTGAIGLMQLMPTTAKQLGVSDPFDPHQNIEGGTKYLRYLIERFDGDVTLALAAYNCGPLNVEKFKKIPPFNETKRYVKKIYSIYKGKRKINLNASGGKSIRRSVHEDGTVVYSNFLPGDYQNY